jgi:hypothetical protein
MDGQKLSYIGKDTRWFDLPAHSLEHRVWLLIGQSGKQGTNVAYSLLSLVVR